MKHLINWWFMSKQFLRRLTIHLSNLKTREAIEYSESFKIDFTFARNNNINTPDTCEVSIYNVVNEFFSNIVNPRDVFIEIMGGYGEFKGRLFAGQLNEIKVGRQGLDVVITLIVGDGLAGQVKTEREYRKKVAYSKIVEDMLNDMKNAGVEIASGVKDYVKSLVSGDKTKTGITFSESVAKGLDKILEPKGLEANIANNELTIRERMKPINRPAVILAWDTGLSEVRRTIIKLKNREGKEVDVIGVEFKCLINPNLIPGQQIKVESEFINGYFTVLELTGTGNTKDGEFVMVGKAHE